MSVIYSGSDMYPISFSGNNRNLVTNNGYIYMLLETWNDAASDVVLKCMRSIDGGVTWVDINMPLPYSYGQKRAEIVTDGTNVYAHWLGRSSTGYWRTYYAKYNGSSWSGPTAVSDSDTSWYYDDSHMSIDDTGNVYFIWTKANSLSSPSTVYIAYRSLSAAGSLSSIKTVKIFNSAIDLYACEYGNGILYISYYTQNTYDYVIQYNPSTGTIISEFLANNDYIDRLVFNNGILYMTNSREGGKVLKWENNQLSTLVTFPSNYGVEIAIDNNYPVAIYIAETSSSGKIAITKYNGQYWSTPIIENKEDVTYLSIFKKSYNSQIYYLWADYGWTPNIIYFDSHSSKLGAPTCTIKVKGNFDSTLPTDFEWNYSDIDGDLQSAFQMVITKVSDGSIVVDTGKVAGSLQKYTLPGDSLQIGLQYQWKVKVWDALNTESQYSNIGIFVTGMAPVIIITEPASSQYPLSSVTVEWIFSSGSGDAQASYRLYLTDSGDNILWDTGQVNDGVARSKQVDYVLQNSTSYKLKFTAWDTKGLQSAETVMSISVSYTPPAVPVIKAIGDTVRGSITLIITYPVPTGSQPAVLYSDVYRDGIRIGKNINEEFTDYTPETMKDYTYMIICYGDNGTTVKSEDTVASVSITDSQLALASDYSKWVPLRYMPSKGKKIALERALMKFSGREDPVSEFSEHKDTEIQVSFTILDKNELDMLEEIISSCKTLLFRDSRGKRLFCTTDGIDERDEMPNYYTVSFTLNKTSYIEEV